MRLARLCGTLAVLLGLVSAAAADTPDPLRLVPDQADVLIQVHQPRRLVDSLAGLDLYKQLTDLEQVKELLDSTSYRRFFQLVAYYEKELGAPYPELIDKLAGGGVVVATKFGANPTPVLAVIQGRDPKLTRKFVDLALQVIEQELARQESKEKIEKKSYRDVEVIAIGKELRAAVIDAALVFSNNDDAMKLALDLHADKGDKTMAKVADVAAARKLLPPDPLATLWVNMAPAHKAPGADEVFKLPRKEFGILLTVLFGGNMDVAGRAPYVCSGLYQEKDGYTLTTRLPAGRDGSDPAMAVHIPPAGTVGSRPLLVPKNVLMKRTSFFLDLGKFWDDRAKLYSKEQLEAFEAFDQQSGVFLAGTRFSKLLTSAGAYHRFVAVQPEKSGYETRPKTDIPAFAVVVEQKDDTFARSMGTVLRAAALFGSTQAGLKLKDEEYNGVKIVGYRFDEKFQLPQDAQDLRFNFSPCFFNVGKQWCAASTIELGREMVDLLMKEDNGETTKGSPESVRTAFYGAGAAALLKSIEDVLITQAILDQAVPVDVARQQAKTLIEIARKLGTVSLESGYDAQSFHYDMRVKFAPAAGRD